MSYLQVYHNRLGLVDKRVVELDAAANQYDEKLLLDRHPDTGQWTVYIKLERPLEPYPLFVLGDELPTKWELTERLQASDSQKRDIRAQMNKANEAYVASLDAKTREEVGKAAEAVEFIARKQGMLSDNTSRRKVVKQ